MKTLAYSLLMSALLSHPALAFAIERITLDQFLNEVRGQNLTLKAQTASAQAAREGASGIQLPAPMAGITQMHDQTGQANGFEISQTIPFPTKLTSEHSARQLESDAKGAIRKTSEREILADARLLYFNLWKAQERVLLLQEKKNATEQHLKLARATTRSDSFLKIHLIKVESDLDLLQNEITQAEQELRETQIRAAEFLGRSPKGYRPIASEFPISSIPREENLQAPSQLEVKRLELETLKSREQEARSSWFPDLNLRYREMGGTQMNPRYSEVMLGATLPFVFFWEPKSTSGKAQAERAQGEFLLAQERRQIESRRATLLVRAESLNTQLDVFKDKLLPKAEKRMRLVHNLAPRDMETLQDHREAMEAFPDLKLKALFLREQYEEAVAELEKFASGDVK